MHCEKKKWKPQAQKTHTYTCRYMYIVTYQLYFSRTTTWSWCVPLRGRGLWFLSELWVFELYWTSLMRSTSHHHLSRYTDCRNVTLTHTINTLLPFYDVYTRVVYSCSQYSSSKTILVRNVGDKEAKFTLHTQRYMVTS